MKEKANKAICIIDKIFEFFEKYFTGFALILFTVIIFANVVGRYVFLKGFTWAEEVSKYLNVWLVFISISAGLKYKSHIGVDAFMQLCIPKKYHRFIEIVIYVVVLVFSVVIAFYGFRLVQKVAKMKQLSAALRMPMVIPYAAIPVGMVMLSVRALCLLLQNTIFKERNESKMEDMI